MSTSKNASSMRNLVAAHHQSGQSQKSFASSHNISKGKLHYWIKKLEEYSVENKIVDPPSFVSLAVAAPPSAETSAIGICTADGDVCTR